MYPETLSLDRELQNGEGEYGDVEMVGFSSEET